MFYRITNANVHDIKAMDWIAYESGACYIFDRGCFSLSKMFMIHSIGAFFVIREKGKPKYDILDGDDFLENNDNILRDQTIRFVSKRNLDNYPTPLRRIVYYAEDLNRIYQ